MLRSKGQKMSSIRPKSQKKVIKALLIIHANSCARRVYMRKGGRGKDTNGIHNRLTSFRVESIAFNADGATASWDISFCRHESPITLNLTVLTSQAIKKILSMSSL